MRKPLSAVAALPIAVALATMGAGVATATTVTSAGPGSAAHQLANCDPISVLSDRGIGKCHDVGFRVGVRCKSIRGDWQTFFSDWTLPGFEATAFCPARWEAVSAEYDLPE